jgi:hypothetical protein
MRASDQPSRLAQLGPSATGTGAATDSEIREGRGRTNPETREAELGGEDTSQGNDGGPCGIFRGTRGMIGTLTPVNCIPTESV